MRIQRGGRGLDPHPPKNHKNVRFLSNTGLYPQIIKPAFNVGPSSARQRNAILMAFHWRVDDGPLIVELGYSFPHQLKNKTKNVVKVGPPLTKLSGSAHACKSGKWRFADGLIVGMFVQMDLCRKILIQA